MGLLPRLLPRLVLMSLMGLTALTDTIPYTELEFLAAPRIGAVGFRKTRVRHPWALVLMCANLVSHGASEKPDGKLMNNRPRTGASKTAAKWPRPLWPRHYDPPCRIFTRD